VNKHPNASEVIGRHNGIIAGLHGQNSVAPPALNPHGGDEMILRRVHVGARTRCAARDPVLSEYPMGSLNRDFPGPTHSAATVLVMQRDRARGGLWALVYLALRRLFELVILLMRSEVTNQVELLELRHGSPC
jgi:hypothetical protein